jgi:hypothetical protein
VHHEAGVGEGVDVTLSDGDREPDAVRLGVVLDEGDLLDVADGVGTGVQTPLTFAIV